MNCVISLSGFLTMIPQLYINYKLKSVANLPWSTLKLNAANSLVSDIAFVFGIPAVSPIPVFSHDTAFLIMSYQRHIYKVN